MTVNDVSERKEPSRFIQIKQWTKEFNKGIKLRILAFVSILTNQKYSAIFIRTIYWIYDDIYLQRQILKWFNLKIYTFNSQIFKSFKLDNIKCINGRIATGYKKQSKINSKLNGQQKVSKLLKILLLLKRPEKV